MQKKHYSLKSTQNDEVILFLKQNYQFSELTHPNNYICVLDIFNDMIDKNISITTKKLGHLIKKAFPQAIGTPKMIYVNNKLTSSTFYSIIEK